jgi:hypothetical protein
MPNRFSTNSVERSFDLRKYFFGRIIDWAFERIDDVLTTLKPVPGIFIAERELVWQE